MPLSRINRIRSSAIITTFLKKMRRLMEGGPYSRTTLIRGFTVSVTLKMNRKEWKKNVRSSLSFWLINPILDGGGGGGLNNSLTTEQMKF